MKTSKKAVFLSLLTAAGILLQLLESFIPVVMIVPGYKIGIANIVSLFALYAFGTREMWVVAFGRIFLSSLLQGNLFSVAWILSVCGGICSMLAMSFLKKQPCFSIYGVSVFGACFHSVGQVLAITWIYQQYFMQLFLPVLLALSVVSGLFIALLTNQVLVRLKGKVF